MERLSQRPAVQIDDERHDRFLATGDERQPFHPNPIAHRVLADHLEEVVSLIRARCKPTSVLLTGSFGRGEGSVLVDGGAVDVLSDIEVAVVSKHPNDRGQVREIGTRLSESSGIDTCVFWLRSDSLKRWRIKSFSFGKQPLSVKVYDILAGSRLLWGEPIDVPIPNAALIPRWEGIRLVFNRMIEALLIDLDGPDPARDAKMTSKLILACVDALIIDQQRYHVRVVERVERFNDHVREIPFLKASDVARTCQLADWAMRYKLEPHPISATDASVLRIATRTFADETFRYLLRRELSLGFASYGTGMRSYVDAVKDRRDYIDYRLGVLTTPLFPNLIYARKLSGHGVQRTSHRMRDYFVPWDQIIYAAGATLFHGRDAHAGIDADSLMTARELLERLVRLPTRLEDDAQEYATLIETTCDLWKTLLC